MPYVKKHVAGVLAFAIAGAGLAHAAHIPAQIHTLQESGVIAPLGKLNVPQAAMVNHCTTMVSPSFPSGFEMPPVPQTVVVRAVIWKTGNVTPMRVASGPHELENAALDAVRMWKYKPFLRDGIAMDVATDVTVVFDPAHAGGLVTHPNH